MHPSSADSGEAITFCENGMGITQEMLFGFFEGWPDRPTPEQHLAILRGSQHVVLALASVPRRVIGFMTALSDGVLSAYIPLLEVLPEYRSRGIGGELVRRMLARLRRLYMVDLVCDADVQPFYARYGMMPMSAMVIRRCDALPLSDVLVVAHSTH